MKKIKVDRFGQIHFVAVCSAGDFDASILTRQTPRAADVRNAVLAHVRKTGHSVSIEAGTHTTYSLAQGGQDEKDNTR